VRMVYDAIRIPGSAEIDMAEPCMIGMAEPCVIGMAEPCVIGMAEPCVIGMAEPCVIGMAEPCVISRAANHSASGQSSNWPQQQQQPLPCESGRPTAKLGPVRRLQYSRPPPAPSLSCFPAGPFTR